MKCLWIVLSAALLTGCSSFRESLDSANGHLIESARQYVDAADKALPDDPNKAKIYTGYAKEVLGPPGESLTDEELQARHKHDADVIAEREKAKNALIELGKQKESENNKNLVSRLWHWGLATFGLVGFIAICVIFPPIIPVLLQLVAHVAIWWVTHFPAIVGAIWRGLSAASSEVYTAIKNSHPSAPKIPNSDPTNTDSGK